ncbi:hypothetical protein V8E36_009026 [Tilletia maclaganii]
MSTKHVTLPVSNDPGHLRADAEQPVQLAYSYWPPTDAESSDAPIIVFLPSEGTDARSIHREQLAASSLRARFHMVALDLRGTGFSVHAVPSAEEIQGLDMMDVLAQDVVDALPLLPGSPLQPALDGKPRLILAGTSVIAFLALRVGAKLGDKAAGLILFSPSSEVESRENAESFAEMVEAWHSANEDLVRQYPDPCDLHRISATVKVPELVSGGIKHRLLYEEVWPPKLCSSLLAHWRHRWLSAKDAPKDLEMFVHEPCAHRTPLGDALWQRITAHVLIVRGSVNQPNGNGQEQHIQTKLVNAASFKCVVVQQAPLLVSVTNVATVNREIVDFGHAICNCEPFDETQTASAGSASPTSPLTEVFPLDSSRRPGQNSINMLCPTSNNDYDIDWTSRPASASSPRSFQTRRSSGLSPRTMEAHLRAILDNTALADVKRYDARMGGATEGDSASLDGQRMGAENDLSTESSASLPILVERQVSHGPSTGAETRSPAHVQGIAPSQAGERRIPQYDIGGVPLHAYGSSRLDDENGGDRMSDCSSQSLDSDDDRVLFGDATINTRRAVGSQASLLGLSFGHGSVPFDSTSSTAMGPSAEASRLDGEHTHQELPGASGISIVEEVVARLE